MNNQSEFDNLIAKIQFTVKLHDLKHRLHTSMILRENNWNCFLEDDTWRWNNHPQNKIITGEDMDTLQIYNLAGRHPQSHWDYIDGWTAAADINISTSRLRDIIITDTEEDEEMIPPTQRRRLIFNPTDDDMTDTE